MFGIAVTAAYVMFTAASVYATVSFVAATCNAICRFFGF